VTPYLIRRAGRMTAVDALGGSRGEMIQAYQGSARRPQDNTSDHLRPFKDHWPLGLLDNLPNS
jgi:hypothetical protein